MTALAIAQAPPPARPLRWLLSAPVWGMVAGIWLLTWGGTALSGRWSLNTVVLVHLFTLGVLGNTMLGALTQFLPVAAGSPLPLSRTLDWLHGAFNLGLALFVIALPAGHRSALFAASLLLSLPLLLFALAALPALLRRGAQRVLRSGIGMALLALMTTALGGALLVAIVAGTLAWPLDRLTDVHAALGLFGWVTVLIAAVGSVTAPMFQGTAAIGDRRLAVWLGLAAASLGSAIVLRLASATSSAMVIVLALAMAPFLVASLWLPLRAPVRRGGPLRAFWRAGTLALVGAWLSAVMDAGIGLPASATMLAGVLMIGIGLPLMSGGMMLEIVGFLAWTGLRADCPRGQRIPGVGRLLPDADKWVILMAQLLAAALLAIAAVHPGWARGAGAALLLAQLATLTGLLRCLLRARAFLSLAATTHGCAGTEAAD